MKNSFLVIACCVFLLAGTHAQTPKEKAEQLASEFTKVKNKEKNKNGESTSVHRVIESKPDIREDVTSYAGIYEIAGADQYFRLWISDNRNLQGDFYNTRSGNAITTSRLTGIRIEDGLLTANLENSEGSTPFEAVFISRTENGQSTKGLGIKMLIAISKDFSVDKAFYKRQE